ncbi:MAG TPA: SMP-30/gluconolactonase/LRE family protein [Gammaproteobacteria bacterium]
MNKKILAAALAAASLAACTDEPEVSPSVEPEASAPAADAQPESPPAAQPAADAGALPDTIVIERGGFIPEGIEYDTANGRILVGSLAEGTVFEIAPDGTMTPVIEDMDLVSSVGIEVDEERNRLLVSNADSSVFGPNAQGPGQAKLGIYDLETGERQAMVDLAAAITDAPDDARHFANDVAVGADGTAFVTDTMMNLIYRVGSDNEASVLHRLGDGAAPNGIVYHDGGFLLVVGGDGNLYKVPVDDPASTSQVMLPEPIQGGDGMVWTADGRLAVVSNSESRVIALASDDDWTTARIAGTASFEGQGTTAAVAGDDLLVVKPHFNDQDPPSIERVTLE